MLLISFIVALALTAFWLRRLTIRIGRIEKVMATIDELNSALDRYNSAVSTREQREQSTIAAQGERISAQDAALAEDTREIADLKLHAVPDDLVQKIHDAAASIEGPAPVASAPVASAPVEGAAVEAGTVDEAV